MVQKFSHSFIPGKALEVLPPRRRAPLLVLNSYSTAELFSVTSRLSKSQWSFLTGGNGSHRPTGPVRKLSHQAEGYVKDVLSRTEYGFGLRPAFHG